MQIWVTVTDRKSGRGIGEQTDDRDATLTADDGSDDKRWATVATGRSFAATYLLLLRTHVVVFIGAFATLYASHHYLCHARTHLFLHICRTPCCAAHAPFRTARLLGVACTSPHRAGVTCGNAGKISGKRFISAARNIVASISTSKDVNNES